MLVKTYTKENLKNEVYEIQELEIGQLFPYLSDWIVAYIFQYSHASLQD